MTLFLVGTLKASVILALGLTATALFHKHSAAVRHWVLAAVLACAAATPLLQFVVPNWLSIASIQTTAIAPPISRAAPSSPAGPAATSPSLSISTTATAPARSVVVSLWAAGVVVSASLLLVGFTRLAWLARRSRRVERGRWREIANQVSSEYGVATPLVLQSDHPALLVTWGLRQAKVILPASAPEWTDDRIRIVLGHELAHIHRRDWAVQMAAEIVRCVYWFNPLVWLACARLRHHSEEACDDAVLRSGVHGPEYAEHLLELARMFKRHRTAWTAAPAIARPSGLERRIAAMLNPAIDRKPMTILRCAITTAALVAITIPVAGFAILEQETPARYSGTVSDPSGARSSEITVSLTNRATKATRAIPTDQSGYFDFASLPPGTYDLDVKAPGFKNISEELTLEPGAAVHRDFKLNIGAVQETITVGNAQQPRTLPKTRREYPSLGELVDRFRGKQLQPPFKVKDVRPEYSQALRDAGVEGTVTMHGQIAADGSVADMQVLSSPNAELSNAALEAVNQWQFEPTRLWGTPVAVEMNVTVNFRRDQ
jgi:TonB family protein